jgi:hypothetical protein
MSSVRQLGKVEAEAMEMRFSGDSLSVSYVQADIKPFSYACLGCGLIWSRKWHAETCEERGHVATWEQCYGGLVENGEYRPAKTYTRRAIGRRKV